MIFVNSYLICRVAIRQAFDYWSKHAEIDFKECESCKANFEIEFASGNHNDGYPFDGPSNQFFLNIFHNY